jgi:hypothetical protein
MTDQVPNVQTTCQDCGGVAYAQRNIMGTAYQHTNTRAVMWLHLRQEDWASNPHNVVPAPADLELVANTTFERDRRQGFTSGKGDRAYAMDHLRHRQRDAWDAQSEGWRAGYGQGWLEGT